VRERFPLHAFDACVIEPKWRDIYGADILVLFSVYDGKVNCKGFILFFFSPLLPARHTIWL